MSTYGRLPVVFIRGLGTRLYDEKGRDYLDFVAGIAVNSLGHCHPAVTEAISVQASRLVHTSNLFHTEPGEVLARRLCGLLGWDDGRVFLANSGAEANECALKLTRKWSRNRFDKERVETISTLGSFHGRTMLTLAATGQPEKWREFEPMAPGFNHVPYDDPAALESAISKRTSAVIVEPIQAEGGVNVPSDDYLGAVRKICDAHEMAFISDEVQTGLGRTGRWFASPEGDVAPDIITLAKSLGNGIPISACAARGELAETFTPGDHATTTGGGPLACAAALAVLDVLEREDLVSNARITGNYLLQGLKDLAVDSSIIDQVRGRGLMLGIQFADVQAKEVVEKSLGHGLLLNEVNGNTVRLTPALTVTRKECDEALQKLGAALDDLMEAQ